MSENFWENIPRGKQDPPVLIWDISRPFPYDFNDPDSQYVMFNRDLEGCIAIPFSKTMSPIPGKAQWNEIEIPCVIASVKLSGFETWWMGVRVGGLLYEYGKSITIRISGFCDTDGNEMLPTDLLLETIPRVDPDPKYAEHEQVALQAAQDGIVLMENKNKVLPLSKGETLNFFGKGLMEFRVCAVGAGKIFPRYTVGLLEAARRETDVRVNEELVSYYARGVDRIPDQELLQRSKAQSNTAIMVISRVSGENMDNSSRRGEYCLTQDEEHLLEKLRESFKNLVVILNIGYPIDLSFVERYSVDAVVYGGFGGMLAGMALMNVLMGRVNPSGKLPDTWSFPYEDIPASRNFYDSTEGKKRIVTDDGEVWLDTIYEEDIYVGYRYFESFPQANRSGYPFGYGLSYTTFSMVCNHISYQNGGLMIQVTVTNTGQTAGREVVQVYIAKPRGKLEQPARELVGFDKTELLQPGKSQTMELRITAEHLNSYDEKLASYILVPGEYQVFLGGDVRHAEKVGGFVVEHLQCIKQVKNRMVPNHPIHCLRQSDPKGTYPTGIYSGIRQNAHDLQPIRRDREVFSHSFLQAGSQKLTFPDVCRNQNLLKEFVGNMDCKTLARLSVCACDGWGVEGRGEAGRLYQIAGLELPESIVVIGTP